MAKLTKPLRYPNANDVHMRLNGCLVRYKDIPYYCVSSQDNDGMHVLLYSLGKMTPKHSVHSSDVELDVSSVPLGYVNYSDEAYFMQRIPMRRQRQGVSSGNTNVCKVGGDYNVSVPTSQIIKSKGMHDSIRGIFPSYQEALKRLRSQEQESVAISRKLAMEIDDLGIIRVHLNETPIGWVGETNVVSIPDREGGSIVQIALQRQGIDYDISL